MVGDTKYTVTDAAKETEVSSREASSTWHQARKDAQESGELPERAANKAAKVNTFDLPRSMHTSEIESELGPDHLFDKTQVRGIIAGLIAEQPNGEEGTLLNNGIANLFYTSSCVMDVRWPVGGREWIVNAWIRNPLGQVAGARAFFPGN